MKYILSLLVTIFTFNNISAQTAPESITSLERGFPHLFESQNIGNLHLFNKTKFTKESPFQGKPIPRKYYKLFPAKQWKHFKRKKTRPHAIYSIRTGAKESYVIRVFERKRKSSLRLYTMKNDALTEIKLLANYRCIDGRCTQTDSWIQDVNGDTQLDIIQKTKTWDKNRNLIKEATTSFSLNNDGFYVLNDDLEFNEENYIMDQQIEENQFSDK